MYIKYLIFTYYAFDTYTWGHRFYLSPVPLLAVLPIRVRTWQRKSICPQNYEVKKRQDHDFQRQDTPQSLPTWPWPWPGDGYDDDHLETLGGSDPSNGDEGENENSGNYSLESPGNQSCLEITIIVMMILEEQRRVILLLFQKHLEKIFAQPSHVRPFILH